MQQPYRATHCQTQSLISHNILLLSIKAHIYNYNQNIRPISVYCSVNLLIVNVESLYIYIIGEIASGGAKQYLIYLRDNWYWLCNVKAVSIFLVETMQSQEFFFYQINFQEKRTSIYCQKFEGNLDVKKQISRQKDHLIQ